MTPREEAGVHGLRLMMEHLDRRNAQNAGDAAELKVALQEEPRVAPAWDTQYPEAASARTEGR